MSMIVGHNLFVMGGWDGYDCLESVEKANLIEENPTFLKLPRENSLLGPVKNGCCVYNDLTNQILIIGGWDERQTTDTIFSYNPETNHCDFAGMRLPKPIEGHSVIKNGN